MKYKNTKQWKQAMETAVDCEQQRQVRLSTQTQTHTQTHTISISIIQTTGHKNIPKL